jgi:tetratricopeptide (TPR) repeat protein
VTSQAPTAEELTEAGNARAAQGDHRAAAELYERALAADPALAVAHNNYALSLTALGRWRESWAHGEWRLQLQEETRAFLAQPPIPLWRGEPLPNELLVLWEQAFGDMLQYLRFLPRAAERVGALSFVCPPQLRRLVAASFPAVELLAPSDTVTWSDYMALVPLLSLPHVLDLSDGDLSGEPYLRVDAADVAPHSGSIGILWRASDFDRTRNCALADLQPLAASGRRLVSLQVQPTDAEQEQLSRWGVEECGSTFKDFYDTARTMQALDAVVTVDTSAAHLAGALGRPTHLLLNEPAAVRWMQETERSPWYPTMRLHRKASAAPWRELLARVAKAF